MFIVWGSIDCDSHIAGTRVNFKVTLKKEAQDEHKSRRQNPYRDTETQNI